MTSTRLLTYINLGKNRGNLGNQLFQIASTIGIANKIRYNFVFPEWKYSKYFDTEFPLLTEFNELKIIREAKFSYQEFFIDDKFVSLDGYLQSEKYFNQVDIRKIFQFKIDFIEQIETKLNFSVDRKSILISIRRGDFVYNSRYLQLSFRYYILALLYYFPEYKKYNLIFTSDDINYCKSHFSFLKNSYFLENFSDIEILAVSTFCSHFIISNSTFSWWMAYLGEKDNSLVIRPKSNFRGAYRKQNNDNDYFPDRWICFNHSAYILKPSIIRLDITGTILKLIFYLNYKYSEFSRKMNMLMT